MDFEIELAEGETRVFELGNIEAQRDIERTHVYIGSVKHGSSDKGELLDAGLEELYREQYGRGFPEYESMSLIIIGYTTKLYIVPKKTEEV